MNIVELKTWAEEQYKKDNRQLMEAGISEKKVAKAKFHLGAVVKDCGEILALSKRVNQLTDITKSNVDFLTLWGMPTPGSKTQKVEEEVKNEEVTASATRDPNWFDARNKKK